MVDLFYSATSAAVCAYLGAAIVLGRAIAPSLLRSVVFVVLNIATVWFVFFRGGGEGATVMALYLAVAAAFFVLMRVFAREGGLGYAVAFLAPLILLVASKLTGVFAVVGLSYLTLRLAHLVWEVRVGRVEPMTPADYLAYAFFFPTFLLGPISPYSFYEASFLKGSDAYRPPAPTECLLRILKGTVKITAIAGIFLQLTPDAYLIDYRVHGFAELPLAAIAFYVFLYVNFSGLNDISIGASGLMGLAVKENFDRPYLAESCTDFWRRWHITLSDWMRDLVFLPMMTQLLRHARWLPVQHATALCIMTVFLLIGWWHGNGWNFWLIGFLFGIAVVAEHYGTIWLKRRRARGGRSLPALPMRILRMTATHLYIAIVVSLMAINFQAYGITPARLLRLVQNSLF